MQFTVYNDDQLRTIVDDIYRVVKFPARIVYEPFRQLKTKEQLGFIFGGLFKVLRIYFFDTQGILYSPDEIKDWIYKKVGVKEKKQYPDGEFYDEVITLSRMDKEQASEFIAKVIDYIELNHPDCVIPPDLRYCWLLHITTQDIESCFDARTP